MKRFSFTVFILVIAIFIACALRFVGLFYGLPLDLFGDEFVHVVTAFSFLNGMTIVASQGFSYVPSFMALLLTPFFGLFGALGILSGSFSGIAGFKAFAILHSTDFLIGTRILSGLFGVGFLWVFWLFVRRLAGSEAALFALLFSGFDFWLVHESQAGHIWMPTTALIICASYALLRVSETGKPRWYFFSALFIGLGFWTGYVPVLLAPFLLVAHYVAPERRTKTLAFTSFFLVFFLGVISWLNPVSFAHQFGRALHVLAGVFGISVFPNLAAISDFASAHPLENLLKFAQVLFWDNPFVLIAGIVGLAVFVLRKGARSFPLILVVGFPILYLLASAFIWTGPDYRYVLPIIPFLIFGAAYLIALVFENRNKVATTFLILVLVWSAVSTIAYAKLLLKPDTRILAREWVIKNIPNDSSIANDAQYLILPQNRAVIESVAQHLPGELRLDDRFLLENQGPFEMPGYFVFSSPEATALGGESLNPVYFIRSFYDPANASAVPASYTLVASFYPHTPIVPIPESIQNPGSFFSWSNLENLGPFVEVYKRKE